MSTLRDFGERRILREILPEYCEDIGDDCGIMGLGSEDIVVTTDPAPIPAAQVIGGDPDPYWFGWLLVTINASDLAAAGAHPLGFLSALELEPEYSVDSLRRLLLGTRNACQAAGLKYIGGNLKEAGRLSAVGTAIGHLPRGFALTRHGATPTDIVVSIGDGGIFWRDALLALREHPILDKVHSPLFAPRSQIRVMHSLASQKLIRAAIDNSDGLLPTLMQLATRSSIQITVELDELSVVESDMLGIDPARLWLGWGDWNVLAAIDPKQLPEILRIAGEFRTRVASIGTCNAGPAAVFLSRHGKTIPAPRLESERFAKDSWFSEGVRAYVERLLRLELPE